MKSHQLSTLYSALEFNISLESLSQARVNMAAEEVLKETFKRFVSFVKENPKLIHLNLTAVNLPDSMFAELIVNIKRSTSLQCVHLCSNNISKENLLLLR